MAREMYLAGVDESELQPRPTPEPPKDLKSRWANYWYHYKWGTLIGLLALIVVIVAVVQMVNREEEDYHLVIMTENAMSLAAIDGLQNDLAAYGEDLNGDGKVVVLIENLYVGGQDQFSTTNQQKFIAYLAAGEPMFYAFDEGCFKNRVQAQLETAEDGTIFFDEPTFAHEDIDPVENYWDWVNSPYMQDEEHQAMYPEHLYFGVRVAAGTANKGSSVKMNEDCAALLQAFATGTPLTEKTE